ncbi:hypothetical protein ACHAXS_001826 [Conticribra weissflogii]
MSAKKLSGILVPPSRIASILDWRRSIGTVLGFDITADKIGLAITEHPENYCHSTPLGVLSLHGRNTPRKSQGISRDSLSEIESIVRENNVCGVVVNWPVNEGRMGERCGKVLQVLDSIVDLSGGVISAKRPFTLWSTHESVPFGSLFQADEWGRSSDFSKAPTYVPGMNYSSKGVLSRDLSLNESKVAASMLDEWIKSNWEIDFLLHRATAPKDVGEQYYFSTQSVDEYQSPCLQSTVL